MAGYTHSRTITYVGPGGRVRTRSTNYAGGQEITLDEAIPDSSVDLEVTIHIDFSALKSIYIESDQAITIETNNGTTPDDTIVLAANEPLFWDTNSPFTNPFAGADVTKFFVTNSSGSEANLIVEGIQDPTP